MEIPKSKKLEIIIPAYRWHSQQFYNALQDITEEMALQRNDGKTNHVLWMAGNLVNDRYWAGNILGMKDTDPNAELFNAGKAIEDNKIYPSLQSLKEEWHKISPQLYERLLQVSDEELQEAYKMDLGVSFFTENKLNAIGMFIGREDYLLGQIGLMRKLLGLQGMSYNIDETLVY